MCISGLEPEFNPCLQGKCFYKWNKFVRRDWERSAPQWPLPKEFGHSAGTRQPGIKLLPHLEHGRGCKQLTSCGSSSHIQTSRNLDPSWIKCQLSSWKTPKMAKRRLTVWVGMQTPVYWGRPEPKYLKFLIFNLSRNALQTLQLPLDILVNYEYLLSQQKSM